MMTPEVVDIFKTLSKLNDEQFKEFAQYYAEYYKKRASSKMYEYRVGDIVSFTSKKVHFGQRIFARVTGYGKKYLQVFTVQDAAGTPFKTFPGQGWRVSAISCKLEKKAKS